MFICNPLITLAQEPGIECCNSVIGAGPGYVSVLVNNSASCIGYSAWKPYHW